MMKGKKHLLQKNPIFIPISSQALIKLYISQAAVLDLFTQLRDRHVVQTNWIELLQLDLVWPI